MSVLTVENIFAGAATFDYCKIYLSGSLIVLLHREYHLVFTALIFQVQCDKPKRKRYLRKFFRNSN